MTFRSIRNIDRVCMSPICNLDFSRFTSMHLYLLCQIFLRLGRPWLYFAALQFRKAKARKRADEQGQQVDQWAAQFPWKLAPGCGLLSWRRHPTITTSWQTSILLILGCTLWYLTSLLTNVLRHHELPCAFALLKYPELHLGNLGSNRFHHRSCAACAKCGKGSAWAFDPTERPGCHGNQQAPGEGPCGDVAGRQTAPEAQPHGLWEITSRCFSVGVMAPWTAEVAFLHKWPKLPNIFFSSRRCDGLWWAIESWCLTWSPSFVPHGVAMCYSKTPGCMKIATSCFLMLPDTFDVVQWNLRGMISAKNLCTISTPQRNLSSLTLGIGGENGLLPQSKELETDVLTSPFQYLLQKW